MKNRKRLLALPQTTGLGESTAVLIHGVIIDWVNRQPGNQIESFDYDDSLFKLGVDSLGMAEIAAEIEARTGKRLDADDVFDFETINELAGYIDSLQSCRELADGGETASIPTPKADDSNGHLLDHYRSMNRQRDQAQGGPVVLL